MAHFAKLNENNNVLAVHVVNNDVITIDGVELEQAGIDFLTGLHGHTLWKQTSYNGSIRKNYAGIGYTYDATRDAFIAPKPFNSWVLDEATCRWQAPTPMPTTEGKFYYWSEDDLTWREITND
jgi:hypothetical protein